MIKFDYKIERDEADILRIFEPTVIPKEIDNLVYIKAPNSSGKSTLLHLIALGLFGLNNKNIDVSLHKKMNSLINTNHQKMEAHIVIENRKGEPELISSINNGKYELKKVENGKEKLILADKFEREYNLIYDIPHNPTDRLKELTQEISANQHRLGLEVKTFSKFLSDTIYNINESLDPNKLKELEAQKRQLEDKQLRYNADISEHTEKIDIWKEFLYTKFYLSYKEKKDSTQSKIVTITRSNEREKATKKTTKLHSEKLINAIRLAFSKINTNKDNLVKTLNEVLPAEDKTLLEQWKKINSLDESKIDEYISSFHEGDQLHKLSTKFSNLLSKEIEKKEYEIAIKENTIYKEIIKFFESLSRDYKNERIILPGIDKTIEDFTLMLYSKNRENGLIKQKFDDISSAVGKLEEINTNLDAVKNKYLIDYEKQKEIDISKIEDPADLTTIQLSALRKNLEDYSHKFDYYKEKCQGIDINAFNVESCYKKALSSKLLPKQFVDYTEEQMAEAIDEKSKELSKLLTENKKIEGEINFLKRTISNLREKKVHKFHNKTKNIEEIFQASQKLSKKLVVTYDGYIKNISDHNSESTQPENKDQVRYYDELSKYLARKLDNIIYNGVNYKVKKLDLIKEEITTVNDKRITFIDFGTGESQATFLKGILETARGDKRKIIALLDEVGMIDDSVLSPVIDSLKQLYEEDKLLVGIVVQKAQPGELEIKSLI